MLLTRCLGSPQTNSAPSQKDFIFHLWCQRELCGPPGEHTFGVDVSVFCGLHPVGVIWEEGNLRGISASCRHPLHLQVCSFPACSEKLFP